MKNKIISTAVALVMCISLFAIPAGAAIANNGYLLIEDFDDYFGTNDMIASAFGGKISSHDNVVHKCGHSSDQGYNGTPALMIKAEIDDEEAKTGGMVMPYLSVGTKSDWTGAAYLQFWAKNETDATFAVRLEAKKTDGTNIGLRPEVLPVYYENRPGEGSFKVSNTGTNRRVNISPGFEGLVRVPLDNFADFTNKAGIASIYLGMNIQTVNNKELYLDNIAVTGPDYVPPAEVVYSPEFNNALLRLNYQTMQLRFSGILSSAQNLKGAAITIKNPDGSVLKTEKMTADENYKIVHYVDLPGDLKSGQYSVSVAADGFDASYKSSFTYTKREPLSFADVEDTNYERSVYLLSGMGIITGYEDGTFRPDNEITRAEFAAITVRILALADKAKTLSEAPFNDTAGHWSAGNIAAGVETGLINGYGDGRFGPDDKVTYEQAVKMLVAALGYDEDAVAAGGYPNGYLSVAKEVGVTKYLSITDNKATRGTISLLLQNTLRAPIKGTKTNMMMENFEEVMDDVRMETITKFADNVLTYGRDYYGENHTDLFTDGLNVYTLEPVVWIYDNYVSILSNFVSQQNLMRVLDGLTNLTGEAKYKDAAVAAYKWHFDNPADSMGLFAMGGHKWMDLNNDVARNGKVNALEYKGMYPYYDLMYEINPEKTLKLIESTWNSLVVDWSNLEITRHGTFNKPMGALWDSKWVGVEPFAEMAGLSFFGAGSDLYYSGLKYYEYTGNEKAFEWCQRIVELYTKCRHPETGLGGYQYSIPIRGKELPADWQENWKDEYTHSGYGDRAKNQFGPEFGDIALEPNVLGTANTSLVDVYGAFQVQAANFADSIGSKMDTLLNWSVEYAEAYAKYAYNKEDNTIKWLLADGTDLSGYSLPRNGYYGMKGTVLPAKSIWTTTIAGFAAAYQKSGSQVIWNTLKEMLINQDLGNLGTAKAGEDMEINFATTCNDPEVMFAVTYLYEMTGNEDYLRLCKAIANNMVMDGFIKGFFMAPNSNPNFASYTRDKAKFDDYDSLAILTVEGYNRKTPELVPEYNTGFGDVWDEYDGIPGGSPKDDMALYSGRYNIEY